MKQIASKNSDYNLTTEQTILSHILDISTSATILFAEIYAGDGTSDIEGNNIYRVRAVVSDANISDSEIFRSNVHVASNVTQRIFDVEFLGRNNKTIDLLLKSESAADSDVYVTTYLYDINVAESAAIQTIDNEIATIDTVVDLISASIQTVDNEVGTIDTVVDLVSASLQTVDDEIATVDTVVDLVSASIAGLNDITTTSVTGGVTVSEAQTHGDTNWITATGFSAHVPSDVHDAFSINTIYVNSDIGNDSNNGTTWDTAKATISDACDTASDGYVIQIGPGIYNESVDTSAKTGLMFSGSGWDCRIETTDGRALEVGNHTTIENMALEGTYGFGTSGYAVYADSKDGIAIRNCWLKGSKDTVLLNLCRVVSIQDCVLIGEEYGIAFTGQDAGEYPSTISVKNTSIYLADWTVCSVTGILISAGHALIDSCDIYATLPIDGASGTSVVTAVAIGDGSSSVLHNCHLKSTSYHATCGARGVSCAGSVLMKGCSVSAVGSGLVYDLVNADGALAVANTKYDTTKTLGTITHVPPGTAILADTNELQSDWTNGGRLDIILDTTSASIQTVDDEIETIDTVVDLVSATLQDVSGAIVTVDSEIETIDTAVDLVSASIQTISGDIAGLNDITVDNIWDAMVSDHRTSGTMGERMSDVITLGPGATTKTYTIKDGDGNTLEGVTVWVTTDIAGTNTIANDITNSSGQVTFNLDSGITYYIWSRKDGYNFTNPDTEIA